MRKHSMDKDGVKKVKVAMAITVTALIGSSQVGKWMRAGVESEAPCSGNIMPMLPQTQMTIKEIRIQPAYLSVRSNGKQQKRIEH